MFAGFASAAFAGSGSIVPPTPVNTKVSLMGTIQLGWYNWTSKTFETYNLTNINTNFTAMVPPGISPGQYNNATFQGYARADDTFVEFYGIVKVNATSPGFMASFVIPNSWPQLPMGSFEACGIVETIITKMTLHTLQYTLVYLVGPVTQFGNETAGGWLNAHAMITNVTQFANVHIYWMPIQIRPMVLPIGGNFSYSFYSASLINASIVAVNYTGYVFYVKGLWRVNNVTFTYYGQDFDQCKENVTVVSQNATGQLEVSALNYTLSIAGFNDVKGTVSFLCIQHKTMILPEWNLTGDVSGPNGVPDGKVDIWDLVAVAKHIGETPGLGQGSFGLQQVEQYDVNFDFHVDMYSLVTVASEIGS